jgi:ABC-type polar amino acid transport system ATPase subunit
MISLQNVEKAFGKYQALKTVSLEVAERETLALIGPSGSGKSTLLRTINLLTPPDAGKITIAGKTVFHGKALAGAELRRMRRGIGMVFQQSHLFTHRSVIENVIEGPVQVLGQSVDSAREEGLALLDRLGLKQFAERYPNQISGGQQQRVAICRALAMKPKVMLFDEPTSALDPELVGEVLVTIRQVAGSGMTTVIVTHEMSFARRVANRIAFMDEGKILEVSTPDAFFRKPQSDRAQAFLDAIRDPFSEGDEQ